MSAPLVLRVIRWASRGLVLAGILLLAYCAVIWGEGAAFQAYAMRHPLRGTIRPVSLHSAIGELEIPRIGLSTVVVEGDDSQALRLGAGHIPSTALPGESGNAVLAGHRDTVFRGLRDVAAGDRILLSTLAGTYTYQVDSIRVTSPDDLSALDSRPGADLTLITCYPFSYLGSAPRRFIVRAHSTDRVDWRQRASWSAPKDHLGSASPPAGARSWFCSSGLAGCWPS